MRSKKILPLGLIFLFLFSSISPSVYAFDWDDDGVDDSIDTDDDNDSILDVDDQCTPGQVNSYSLGMRDHDSDGCDDHEMFISNAFLEGDGTDVISEILIDSYENQIVAGYSTGNYSKFENYNITIDPNVEAYTFISKINSSGIIDWFIYTNYYERFYMVLGDDDSIFIASDVDRNITWNTPSGIVPINDTNDNYDPYIMKVSTLGVIEWIEHNENTGNQYLQAMSMGSSNNMVVSIANVNNSTMTYGNQVFSLKAIEGFVINISSSGIWGPDIISIENPNFISIDDVSVFSMISNTDNGYMSISSYQEIPSVEIKKNGVYQCSINKNNSQTDFYILSFTLFYNWDCIDSISVEAHTGYAEAWVNNMILDFDENDGNVSIGIAGGMEADTFNYSTLEFGNWGIITPQGEYTYDGYKAYYGEIIFESSNSTSSLDWDVLIWDNSNLYYLSIFTELKYTNHALVLCGNFFSTLVLVSDTNYTNFMSIGSITGNDYDSFCIFVYNSGNSGVNSSLGYFYKQFGFSGNDIITAIDLDNTGIASIAIASTSTYVTFNNTNITTNGSSYDTHLFKLLFEEDYDDDNDGIQDYNDQCALGDINWNASNSSQDWDWDGCKDSTEDLDDDNDGLEDTLDACPRGLTNWSSLNYYEDYDGDGCNDYSEDLDDDNDGVLDADDFCSATYSVLGWTSDSTTDYDGDGCQDITEDLDDDNDGLDDTYDNCPTGLLNWQSGDPNTDWDGDGCEDSVEDDDDDNDQRNDVDDTCPRGELNWNSQSTQFDFDSDGCKDGVEDWDDDNDGVYNENDDCNPGEMSWISSNSTDYDSDGCRDLTEDFDDDNDGKEDAIDDCLLGDLGWTSTPFTDYDGDGCKDSSEDLDDDNDGVEDLDDLCPLGEVGWISTELTDYDGDGCKDAQEDDDYDNDGVLNQNDSCKRGDTSWASNSTTDYDYDGCRDSTEDLDDDNDGVPDISDLCSVGLSYWYSNSETDYDSDGCYDQEESLSTIPWDLSEDLDDDNDGALDIYDDCVKGTLGWNQFETLDHDMDGCFDGDEDIDDDNDGILDLADSCSTGVINWTSNSLNDYDNDGCFDSSEDEDDDNDLILDAIDLCPIGDLGWISFQSSDYDNDGCKDSTEDFDDDNDNITDLQDLCPTGKKNWISSNILDYDEDGCYDASEDEDDDNDLINDNYDSCPKNLLNWTSNSDTDHDSDGCNDQVEDDDDDNDGMEDSIDQCPLGDLGWISTPETDFDNDGCQDSEEDYDDDGDGVIDSQDMFPLNPAESFDSDGDGIGNNEDAFPNDSSETVDTDGDGVGDNTDIFPSTSWLGSGTSFTIIAIIVISIIGGIVIIRIRKNNAPIPEEQTKSFRQQEEFFEEISSDALSLAGMAPILTEEQIKSQTMPPSNDLIGEIDEDGYEWIEHPVGSEIWYWKGSDTNAWELYEE